MEHTYPKIAIIDSNTLAALGLRNILLTVMPMMDIETFGTMAELNANHPECYVHFFVSMNIALENRSFFMDYQRKTIVLTPSASGTTQFIEFHCLCTNVPEAEFIRSLLALQQKAHGAHGTHPMSIKQGERSLLSDREAEVMVLIVKGFINKEIANRLNIGLATVVTHRKNIMEKLGVKSVSALTIYAVMNGYVDINKI